MTFASRTRGLVVANVKSAPLALIWMDGPLPRERLYLAAALSVAIYGAFFAAALARPLFGGSFYDKNGYLPFKPPFGPDHWRWDVNVTAFTILTGILMVGIGVVMVG